MNNTPVNSGVGFDQVNVRNTLVDLIPYGRGVPIAYPIVPTAQSGGVVMYVASS